MGMQITSLSMGGNLAVSSPQESQEKTLPMEKKPAAEHQEAPRQETKANPAPDLKQTTSDLEQIGLAFNRRLKFEIDTESREIIVKVIDNETDKVIKVLPPEELQRLHSRIRETIGFLFDRMV